MGRIALSVNINKYALLRNSRGRNLPDLLQAADTCIAAGCHGITVHPRLDERHVQLSDLRPLTDHLRTQHPGIEFNIECEDDSGLLMRVHELAPDQCTLVPVTPGEVTSDHGWRIDRDIDRLRRAIDPLVNAGIRVSLFADCEPQQVQAFAQTGAQRVELYTGPYAWAWGTDRQQWHIDNMARCVQAAREVGLEVNAGHDLDPINLAGLRDLAIDEVSIGHAQICRALEVGTTASVKELLAALGWC